MIKIDQADLIFKYIIAPEIGSKNHNNYNYNRNMVNSRRI
jgi:hypothetical protein